jgi:hypothetical protein
MVRENVKKSGVLEEIFVLKGIAIIGVIIMHIYPPLINQSFTHLLKNIFTKFSMEIFMFTSGFLFGYSRSKIQTLSDYMTFVYKKFKRLMIPYFVLSGIILLLKSIAAGYVTLRSPVNQDFWKHIIFNPIGGYATFLWFLYFLFLTFLTFPILLKIIRNHSLLLTLLLVASLIPIPQFFYFNHELYRWFLFFFCSGYVYSYMQRESFNRYGMYLFIPIFGLSMILSEYRDSAADVLSVYMHHYSAVQLLKVMIVLLGSLAYYFLSLYIKKKMNPVSYFMKYLGMYSASIYLLHTISMGLVRIFFIDVLNISDRLYPFVSIIIFLTGFIGPVLITKYLINKFVILPPLILGVKKG